MKSSWILPAARRRPSTLGLVEGKLAACPNSPNCVSSQATGGPQRVEPLSYPATVSREQALAALLEVLAADPRAEVIQQDDQYVHAEFAAMFFVDDVEFLLPTAETFIHVRSASRLGHSDLGANRRRVEALRKAFLARL